MQKVISKQSWMGGEMPTAALEKSWASLDLQKEECLNSDLKAVLDFLYLTQTLVRYFFHEENCKVVTSLNRLNLLELLVWKITHCFKTVIFLRLNTFWESHPHLFSFWGWHSLNLSKSRQFFSPKKIKRVSDLNFFALLCALCHNRICQTWWTSFTCHFLFSHWRPKRERWTFSCARDCQTPVFLRVETERQFHNFYYWMFCLIKKAVLQND